MMSLLVTMLLAGFAFNNHAGFLLAQDSSRQEQKEQERQRKSRELLTKASHAEVEFTGNTRIPSSLLFEQMKLTRNPDATDRFTLRCPVFLEHLLNDLERVRFFLGTQGFLEAKIPVPKIEDFGDRLKITVDVREGARYWVGEVRVKNAKVFTSEQIVEISGLKPGVVIDAGLIQEKIFKGIKDSYGDEGYIQASVDFIPQFRLPYPGSPEGVLDVMLEVDEGRRFSIESIGFLGLAKAEEQTIRDLLPIKAGSRYSRKTLLETLRILNRLGLFEEVRENDIITRTNIGGPTVNLDFQLKEKNK